MNYYIIEPEVAGEIGGNTIYDNYDDIINKKKLPIISHLHFIFDGWLGDELLEVTPCFLVSERIKKEIERHGFSGCKFTDVEISYSQEFMELNSARVIPKFYRMIPFETLIVDNNCYVKQEMYDFMVTQKSYLIISENVKNLLATMNLASNADYILLGEH